MSQIHIRLARTPDVDRVLFYLRNKYSLLSEAEIIKLALSEKYQKEIEENKEKEQKVRNAYNELMTEGKKLGDKLLAEKGLKREDVTEEEFHNLFLAPKKNA